MKRFLVGLLLLTAFVLLSPKSSSAQTCGSVGYSCDIYRGRLDINGTATGSWHTQKIGNRWWIITPLGHGLFYQSIGSWQAAPATKYGTACQGAAQISIEVDSWNFNGFGQNDGNANGAPNGPCSSTPGFINMPHMEFFNIAQVITAANFGIFENGNYVTYASAPTKNLTFGIDSNSAIFKQRIYTPGLVDVFAPEYVTFVNNYFFNQIKPFAANPFNFGVLPDDTDFLNGFGGTSDFDTVPPSHNKTNMAYNIAVTSPIQTWDGGVSGCCDGGLSTRNGINVFYTDPVVHTKGLMASPPATCTTATPCTWATYLQKKYSVVQPCAGGLTGIAGLDACWGSNYSVACGGSGFGSCGKCVGWTDILGSICGSGSGSASEQIDITGNGVKTTFSKTLANTPVSIHSVQLVFNGTDIISGDCPESGMGRCAVTTGLGQFQSPSLITFILNSASNTCPDNSGVHPCYKVGQQYLDSNGYLETVTTQGDSGSSVTWTSSYKGSTTTGTAVFRNDGPVPIGGPQPFLQSILTSGTGSGFPSMQTWAQITYHGTPPVGTSSQVVSRLVGASPSIAGQTAFVTGPDGFSGGNGNPTWITGYDVYMACRVISGSGAAFGCADQGPNTAPPLTLQASNVPVSQVTLITCSSGTITINVVGVVPSGFAVGDSVNLFKTNGGFDLGFTTPGKLTAVSPTALTYNQPGGTCPSPSGSGGTIWKWFQLPNAPMAAGTALPLPPSSINYASGLVNVTFSAPLQTGVTLNARYIASGFGFGLGLLDEDGRGAWMGQESISLLPVANTGPGSTSWASRIGNPGGNPTPTTNINAAIDMVAYQTQVSAQYFGTMKSALVANAPTLLYMGTDTLGDWCTPPHQEVLAGALPFLDILWTTWCADATEATQRFNYFGTARGDAPLMNFLTICANLDSAAAFSGPQACADSTQPARAQRWYDTVNTELNTIGPLGSYQWVGLSWWGLRDFIPGENTNWGLKTTKDNAYDGSETSSSVVSCSPPLITFSCGGETAPGNPWGNLIGGTTGVKSANSLWLLLPSTVITLGVSGSGVITGTGVIKNP